MEHESTGAVGDGVSELALALDGVAHSAETWSDEDRWVSLAREGDLEAFDAIMQRYEGRLLRFLAGMVGDMEVARELCQDTFLAAYQSLPRLRGDLRLSAWLHTIALNRARSYHRRRRLRSFLPLDDESCPSSAHDLQDTVAHAEAIHRTLERMPRQYATVLLLQTGSGLSCREIADVVGCSEGAVKVRLMRARESFRRIWDTEGR